MQKSVYLKLIKNLKFPKNKMQKESKKGYGQIITKNTPTGPHHKASEK
jgi:hypothetical protein